jgi:hypothetical protein
LTRSFISETSRLVDSPDAKGLVSALEVAAWMAQIGILVLFGGGLLEAQFDQTIFQAIRIVDMKLQFDFPALIIH